MSLSVTTYSTRGLPTIKRFLRDASSHTVAVMGPFGSGKSVACVVKCIMLAHTMPPCEDGVRRTRIAVIRNTYPQLEDTTLKTVFSWLPPAQWGVYTARTHTYRVTGLNGIELELMFRALDRPDHVQNLLSLELSHAWINECREIDRAILGPLRGRLGRYPPRDEVGPYTRVLLMDTNPPDVDSWFYELFEDRKPEGATLYRQPGGLTPSAENLSHLPDGYYTEMAQAMSAAERRVYIDAEYGYLNTGKPVYAEYNDTWHCAEFEVHRRPIRLCWDFGLTPACVFVQTMPDGQVRAIDELCAERAGIQSFAPLVLARLREQYPWSVPDGRLTETWVKSIGDPAGEAASQTDERSCFDILRAAGFDTWPGSQDPVLRLESVRYLLRTAIDGRPGLLIHPRCKMLRKGFQGEYQYRRLLVSGTDRYADKPTKNKYSHPHDALQYGAVDIVGDRVQGLAGAAAQQPREAVSSFDPLSVGRRAPPLVYDDELDDMQGDTQWQHSY